ncbi:MAG: RluA family pseudouridine synthase [Rhizobiales bacterium]|nr:RluA family pseudouridine synthase [Hyphomicrobiales bacterium]
MKSPPPPQLLTATVDTEKSGERLDRFLAATFPETSRARFQALIAEGHVAVEGEPVREARRKLKDGEKVAVELPAAKPAEPAAEAIALDIVFEDDDLIVIDKPAGLVVHPAAGHDSGTLVNALLAHCGESLSGIGGIRRPGIVHRLDKETSGLMVVAKTDRAHQGLSEQFASHGRDGRLEREYLALVWRVPERRRGTIDAPLARSSHNRQKIAVSRGAAARTAITHYEVEEQFGNIASLIRCRLETGRTHQIRVHLAHIGHPVLGDPAYGKGFSASRSGLTDKARDALAALNRQALHAAVLGFDHPVTGEHLRFERATPADMQRLLASLRIGA